MGRRKSKSKTRTKDKGKGLEGIAFLLLLIALAAAFVFNFLADRVSQESVSEGDFDVLRGARLVSHGGNDGDSFQVSHAGKEFVFRLYYVDCNEKSASRFRSRLEHQGKYFGGLGESEVVELGLEAKDYVDGLLKKGRFEIYTRWEPVYDSGRFFAMVKVRDRWLSELLVERGLARIYTKGIDMPNGRKFRDQRNHLRELEAKAKTEQLGGWQ